MKPSSLFTLLFFPAALFLVTACDDDDDSRVRKFASGNIETVAGSGPASFGYDGDNGQATSAKLGWITSVAVDSNQYIYLTDGAANVVRKITDDGIISTIAGTFIGFNQINTTPFAGDEGPSTSAHLNIPYSIETSFNGNVIIADAGNNAVRKISTTDGVITTIAGKGPGLSGFSGDGGHADQSLLSNPHAIAYDRVGNIYIADTQNNVIRMISAATGMIATIAGLGPNSPGYSGDNGQAIAAAINSPEGIVVGIDGSIYFSDGGNNVLRKIYNGIITTIAGTGAVGYSGDDGPALNATFYTLRGLAIDNENNIYIADASANVIRMIDSETGKIFTVAGNGQAGFAGDGGPAIEAMLSNPMDIAVDNEGNLYIADTNNAAIRVVTRQ